MSPGLVEKAVASDALLKSDTDSVENDAIERGGSLSISVLCSS